MSVCRLYNALQRKNVLYAHILLLNYFDRSKIPGKIKDKTLLISFNNFYQTLIKYSPLKRMAATFGVIKKQNHWPIIR